MRKEEKIVAHIISQWLTYKVEKLLTRKPLKKKDKRFDGIIKYSTP